MDKFKIKWKRSTIINIYHKNNLSLKIMEFKDILNQAFKVSTNIKYKVILDGILKEMSYMELGLFLTTNSTKIDKIKIIMKE